MTLDYQRIAITRRGIIRGALAVGVASGFNISQILAQTDPLPSWNDGPAKQSILDFVARVTRPESPDFVPVPKRIATFDNDGTLWSEQPIYFQVAFTLDRLKALAPQHPDWWTTEPYKALLEGDVGTALAGGGMKALLALMEATSAGLSTEEFSDLVREWLNTARHPRFNRPYTDLVYLPMLELLAYLRDNDFKTFIVSGGGVDFMRAWVEGIYGIPPEQIVGSSGVTKYQIGRDGKPELYKEAKIEFVDDGPGKPAGINRFIGRRPIFAFGNSDGDQQMLEWTDAGEGARFMALLHHTDAKREWAYDRKSLAGKLDTALDEARARNWLVVDMARDWKRVFAFEQ